MLKKLYLPIGKQQKKREEVMALVANYNFPEPEDLWGQNTGEITAYFILVYV